MAFGKRAHQPRRDLGAFYRGAPECPGGAAAPPRRSGRNASAWCSFRVGQQFFQIRAIVAAAAQRGQECNLHQMRVAVAGAESCTRQSRSRCGFSPMVSVSTATTGPRSKSVGQVVAMQGQSDPAGVNCVAIEQITSLRPLRASAYAAGMLVPRRRLELPQPYGHRYLKPARLPIPPPGQGAAFGEAGV